MINSLMDTLILFGGVSGFFFVFFTIAASILRSFAKGSEADQDPADEFEVREEWKDFM